MYMILRHPQLGWVDALLLSATAERMRVVVPNRRDTLEFRQIDGRWISDDGRSVEVESLLAAEPSVMACVWPEKAVCTIAASR